TRALAGAFVSAVAPIASAFVTETAHEDRRARRLAWLGAGSLAGFLVGPALSGWAAQAGKALAKQSGGAIALPLYATALLALLVALAVYLIVPRHGPHSLLAQDADKGERAAGQHSFFVVLALNLLVTFGLGSFEVGITLQMRQSLGYEPSQLALMFAECSLV